MTKSELKNGAVVECRNGNRYIKIDGAFINTSFDGFMPLCSYKDDLTACDYDYDIINVNNNVDNPAYKWCPSQAMMSVSFANNWTWKREEKPVEMTVSEIGDKLGIKNLKIVKE